MNQLTKKNIRDKETCEYEIRLTVGQYKIKYPIKITGNRNFEYDFIFKKNTKNMLQL